MKRKDLVGLSDLSKEELDAVLDHALEMERIVDGEKISQLMRGKSVFHAFYENSTRTQASFSHAAKLLGATSVELPIGTSSVKKGESLLDTAKTLCALGADAIVVRHEMAGAPAFLAENLDCSIVNAGDGLNEHPTQALLDMFTMQKHFGRDLKGLNVLICGDIKHSRVARSNMWGLRTMGANVTLCSPPTLMIKGIEAFPTKVIDNFDEGIKNADVVMLLRMQRERMHAGIVPGMNEYKKYYQLTYERVQRMREHAIIMHPAPVNRGVEIAPEAADCAKSVINEQVHSGLCVRMSVLDILTGGRT